MTANRKRQPTGHMSSDPIVQFLDEAGCADVTHVAGAYYFTLHDQDLTATTLKQAKMLVATTLPKGE